MPYEERYNFLALLISRRITKASLLIMASGKWARRELQSRHDLGNVRRISLATIRNTWQKWALRNPVFIGGASDVPRFRGYDASVHVSQSVNEISSGQSSMRSTTS